MSCHCVRKQVREFQQATGAPSPATPQVPDLDRVRLRMALIIEECIEMLESVYGASALAIYDLRWNMKRLVHRDIATVNLVELADALADIDYVVEGTRQEFGIDGAPIAAAVHASNMTKVGAPKDENGKVTKGIGYFAPAIAECLLKQGWTPPKKTSSWPPAPPSLP
jgi:predicted HAD superfamily Cof-like phosphohydrolase